MKPLEGEMHLRFHQGLWEVKVSMGGQTWENKCDTPQDVIEQLEEWGFDYDEAKAMVRVLTSPRLVHTANP